MLFEQGVRTVLLFGAGSVPEGYDAAVVCLKTRSIAAGQARALTMEALERLRRHAPRQAQFKYCSTFDSTPEGNIGPVIDELLAAFQAPYTVAVPALPVNGRTQYLGHLFVNGAPLNESPMRHHPLNPMTDANLARWLQRQTERRVGLVALPQVRSGQFAVEPGIEIAMNVAALGEEELARLEGAARGAIERTGVALIRSSALPDARVPGAAAALDRGFARLAVRLTPLVGKLIVAGGETAGAVVDALGVRAVELTGILDPGVPTLRTIEEPSLWLALKSGNFGSRDFFTKALHHA